MEGIQRHGHIENPLVTESSDNSEELAGLENTVVMMEATTVVKTESKPILPETQQVYAVTPCISNLLVKSEMKIEARRNFAELYKIPK